MWHPGLPQFVRLVGCEGKMGTSWQARRNAAESDARRMYLRGQKGTLKIEPLPLEHALAYAKFGPELQPTTSKGRSAKPKPLGSESGIIAVSAAEANQKNRTKREQVPWAAGHLESASVLRPKARKNSSEPVSFEVAPVPESIVKSESKMGKKNRNPRTVNKRSKKRKSFPQKYEGQPRYEGGFRIVQGGLFEHGKR